MSKTGYSTVSRFESNGVINQFETVFQTAKFLLKHYDDVSAQDIALELTCQGVEVEDKPRQIVMASGVELGNYNSDENFISVVAIKRVLNKYFTKTGNGYYTRNSL